METGPVSPSTLSAWSIALAITNRVLRVSCSQVAFQSVCLPLHHGKRLLPKVRADPGIVPRDLVAHPGIDQGIGRPALPFP